MPSLLWTFLVFLCAKNMQKCTIAIRSGIFFLVSWVGAKTEKEPWTLKCWVQLVWVHETDWTTNAITHLKLSTTRNGGRFSQISRRGLQLVAKDYLRLAWTLRKLTKALRPGRGIRPSRRQISIISKKSQVTFTIVSFTAEHADSDTGGCQYLCLPGLACHRLWTSATSAHAVQYLR